MYQIFVVEDELLIRQSIRNTIERSQGPYTCCGEASDGEMALSMMQELMPDILITDIRMPFLDGFGLIEHVKSIMPWLKIVIISGYGDFEFAQKAITLGVDRYLLKPVRQTELMQVLEDITAQIEKEKSQTAGPEGFDRDEVRLALIKHFMQQLLYGGTDTSVLLEQARTLKLDVVRSCYQVVICHFDAPDLDYRRIRSAVKKLLENRSQVLFYFNAADQMTLLICDSDRNLLDEAVYQYINMLRHELKEICPVITIVIGSQVQRLGEISSSHKKALEVLKRISIVATGQVINADDTSQLISDLVTYSGPFDEDFPGKLQYSSAEDVPQLLESVLSGSDGERFQSTLVRYNALVYLLKVSAHIIADNTPGKEEREIAEDLTGRYNVFTASGQFQTFRQTAREMLTEALATKKNNYTEVKYNRVIYQATRYVLENFCDPDISLISVAKHVGMSPAHFSTIFSQKQGQTFINYLTGLRIEKARELLTSTGMKLADIALEVGYNEPNYFSHVFRKTVGMTPKEYRNQNSR